MNRLAAPDRAWRAFARYVERPTLAGLSSQAALRQVFLLTTRVSTSTPRGTKRHLGPDGSLWLTPPGVASDAPCLFYIHGGGFTIGAPETHEGFVAHLALAAGMRALLVRYRLAPEHPFPAAPHDVIAAWSRVCEDGSAPAAICGDSAGGCLSLLLAMHIRDHGMPAPRALVLVAPIGDLDSDIGARIGATPGEHLIPARWARRIRACYLPSGVDPGRPDVSPLHGDLHGLPPAMIQASDCEVLAEDARRLARRMDDATLDLHPGLQHVWHLHAGRSPAADRAVQGLARFLKDRCR